MAILEECPQQALLLAETVVGLAEDIETGEVPGENLRSPGLLLRGRIGYTGDFQMMDNIIADFVDPNREDLADALPPCVIEACAAIESFEPSAADIVTDEDRLENMPVLLRVLAQLIIDELP